MSQYAKKLSRHAHATALVLPKMGPRFLLCNAPDQVEDRLRCQYFHTRRLLAQYIFDEKRNAAIGRGRSYSCPSLFAPPS
ncbi:hypothetical protein EMIT0196MI5_390003 [Pseudomonas sp. IT-196MI5]